MHKKIIAMALFATASVANAGGYFGAGLGQSSADVGQYYGPSVSVSDTDTAFKIFGGYEFNENIAIEGGYTYLGEFGGSYTYTDGFYLYTDSEMVEAGAFYVAAVATIPLGPVSLFGKAGFAHWIADYTYYDDWYGYAFTDAATGIDPVVGAGVKFNLSQSFVLRGEFERYMDVGDPLITGQSDVDVISVNAVLQF